MCIEIKKFGYLLEVGVLSRLGIVVVFWYDKSWGVILGLDFVIVCLNFFYLRSSGDYI